VQGNLELAVLGVLYALIGAGFYEEFMFRGVLMQGLAMFFGGSRGAWIAACVLQGALFGLAHAYQNPLGIAITGALGVLTGLLVLASGRNLWPVIIGHDSSTRVVSFCSISRARRWAESLSTIQQTGIEAIFDRLANLDLIKIRMPRI
jgi:hypothetical protein